MRTRKECERYFNGQEVAELCQWCGVPSCEKRLAKPLNFIKKITKRNERFYIVKETK